MPWQITYALKDWQREALAAWERADHRGVIEAATGTGKTAVALAAIAALHDHHGDDLHVAVVLPTLALAAQWQEQLETALGLPRSWIGQQHSAAAIEWRPEHRILITVVSSARTRLGDALDAWLDAGKWTLLVVDECHRTGSEYNSLIFEAEYD